MNFEIVSYVSKAFRAALRIMLPSWIQNSGATTITIYTDHNPGEPDREEPNGTWVRFQQLFEPAEDERQHQEAWFRKITVLETTYLGDGVEYFCWLDADVYCAQPFTDVFERMGSADIAATRMFNRTKRGNGKLNAGILFFRRNGAGSLLNFFHDWEKRSRELEGKAEWFEQVTASNLIHEAYHGLKPYYATPVSEELYNCEDDDNVAWLERIARYRPRLIHFKTGRWKEPELIAQVMVRAGLADE